MLSDGGIGHAQAYRLIAIEPWDAASLQPCSYDVHLGERFLEFAPWTSSIDCARPAEMVTAPLEPDGSFILRPGEFALAATVETVTLSAGIAAIVAGKSSLARRGLGIETAGFIDAGFSGQVTLELANLTRWPLVLWPGMAIGQLAFFDLDAPALVPYGPTRGSHYQDQRGPTVSAVHRQIAERLGTGRVSDVPSP